MDKKSPCTGFIAISPYLSAEGLWYFDCSFMGMNWRQVENQWQHSFGTLRRSIGTGSFIDDLNGIMGRRASLVKTLELRYNMTPAEADRCADQWLRMTDTVDTVDMRPAHALNS